MFEKNFDSIENLFLFLQFLFKLIKYRHKENF